MHKNRPDEFFLVDVLVALDRIKRYSAPLESVEDLEQCDEIISDALMRELEILGEAMKHVLRNENFKHVVNHEWRVIVSFRNIVVHEYFGIDMEEVFDAIKNELPKFEIEFLECLAKLKNNMRLYEAFEDMRNELERTKKLGSIAYLNSVEEILNK